MTKSKFLILIFMVLAVMIIIPNISNAAEEITITRNIYSNNGSMKFTFTGLELDTTHEYEFGITKTAATTVLNWYSITEYTGQTATVDVITTTNQIRGVINAVDTGYITIKDKTIDTIILQPHAVDLKLPYLNVTNYSVINNGKELGYAESNSLNIALRNASNSEAYYQYEKITDENIINKYKEIKANNGNVNTLQTMLKTTAPNSNWFTWVYWNGHSPDGMNGYGRPTGVISAPDTGLYYLWVYFSGNNIKNVYGYILVDNLQPDVALESISLPKTKTVKLGETLTLSPTFNPSTATNKIVTWTSSDETVATIDNAGKITPKKLGSTIITVVSQDGNKKATCTVTVTATSSNNSGTNGLNNGSTSSSTKKDTTTATGKLPQTGLEIGIFLSIIVVLAGGIFAYFKYNRLKNI